MTKKSPAIMTKHGNNNLQNIFKYKRRNKIMNNLEKQYTEERGQQLVGKTNEELIDMVASLELELLDYADRLLSDNPIPMDCVTADGTLDLIGEEAVDLLKSLDTEKEYDGLASYGEHWRDNND